MKHHITSYEILRHGVEHSDYFQGCGVSFTDFDHVVTGIGDTEKEAFEDALEQLCMSHCPDDGSMKRLEWDCEHKEWDSHDVQSCSGLTDDQWEEMCESGSPPYWHVSIRYNAEAREEIPA